MLFLYVCWLQAPRSLTGSMNKILPERSLWLMGSSSWSQAPKHFPLNHIDISINGQWCARKFSCEPIKSQVTWLINSQAFPSNNEKFYFKAKISEGRWINDQEGTISKRQLDWRETPSAKLNVVNMQLVLGVQMHTNGWQSLPTDACQIFIVGELHTDLFDNRVWPIGHLLYHYDV